MTYAETVFWKLVRGRGFEHLKFRRQVPLGPYVVDFLCRSARLVVELDGGIHDAPFYDLEKQAARDAWLQAQGFTVLRFKNSELEQRGHLVMAKIRNACPSPLGEKVSAEPTDEGAAQDKADG